MDRTSAPVVTQQRATPGFVALYAVAYATLWLALLTPAMISLALRVRELVPGDPSGPLSGVLAAGALVALITNPVFGALSDQSTSRFGRRSPFLVVGVVCGCAALLIIGLARSVTVVLLGWCLAQLAYNAALSAMVAIVPDRIPAPQRGTVVGVLGVCMPVGQITGTYLVQELSFDMLWALVVPGVLGAAGVVAFVFMLRDKPQRAHARGQPPVSDTTPGAIRGITPSAVAIPDGASAHPPASPGRSHRDFSWAWLSRVLFTTGSCFLQAYQPLFLLEKLKIDAGDIPRLIFRSTLVSAAMVVVWSLIAGRLSDGMRSRKPFVMAGSVVQGMGLWLIAASDSYPLLLLGVALTGTGHGIYEGVDLALVTEVLPDRDQHAAKDLGLLNIANTLPQVIAPLSAPAILAFSGGDYAVVFAVAGAVAMLGSMALVPLRHVR